MAGDCKSVGSGKGNGVGVGKGVAVGGGTGVGADAGGVGEGEVLVESGDDGTIEGVCVGVKAGVASSLSSTKYGNAKYPPTTPPAINKIRNAKIRHRRVCLPFRL